MNADGSGAGADRGRAVLPVRAELVGRRDADRASPDMVRRTGDHHPVRHPRRDVDGSDETNLTNSDFDEIDVAWAPDGSKIAFAGVRFETWSEGEGAQWEIVLVNPDGSGEQILTAGEPGTPRATMLEEDRAPAWSPDSALLVYQTQSVDPCCPPWQLEKVDRDGSDIRLLSDNPAWNDLSPAFSPDGTLVVFVSDRDGELAFYTMPAPTVDLAHRPDGGHAAPHARQRQQSVLGTAASRARARFAGGRRPRRRVLRRQRRPRAGRERDRRAGLAERPVGSADVHRARRPPLTGAARERPTSSTMPPRTTAPPPPAPTSGCYDATPAHDCYRMTITGPRPETIGTRPSRKCSRSGRRRRKTWTLHVGNSFSDVAASEPFYPFIENLFHNGVTGGCGGDAYCPDDVRDARARWPFFSSRRNTAATTRRAPASPASFSTCRVRARSPTGSSSCIRAASREAAGRRCTARRPR